MGHSKGRQRPLLHARSLSQPRPMLLARPPPYAHSLLWRHTHSLPHARPELHTRLLLHAPLFLHARPRTALSVVSTSRDSPVRGTVLTPFPQDLVSLGTQRYPLCRTHCALRPHQVGPDRQTLRSAGPASPVCSL